MATDRESSSQGPQNALYVVAFLGTAALSAVLSAIAVKLTHSKMIGNMILGITIALGIYPILSVRAASRGVKLSFWKYATAFVILAIAVNAVISWIL